MAEKEYAFITPDTDQAFDRDLLILYLNTGEKATPKWAPVGCRVESSNEEKDWQRESKKDIMGHTHNTMKKPITTQGFDPWPLAGNDEAQKMLWELAIAEEDAAKLSNMDILVVHGYVEVDGKPFAVRHDASSIEVTSLGGDGGGTLNIAATVTYGGNRTKGTVDNTTGEIKFTEFSTDV